MGRRSTFFVAIGLFLLLAVLLVGALQHGGADANAPTQASTYLATPDGISAIAEAAERMGTRVDRWRRSYRELPGRDTLAPAPLFAVVGPAVALFPREALLLSARVADRGPVLAAGPSAGPFLACYGWTTDHRGEDSIRVRIPGAPISPRAGWVRWVLRQQREPAETDAEESKEGRYAGVRTERCAPRVMRVDTLLVTAGGRPVLVRVEPRKGWPVYLLSDPSLLSNRVVRESDVGPYFLRLFAAFPAGVRFDEYHQGFDENVGMVAPVVEWSSRSPWGWAAWQLVAVGLIALAVAMIRTGPIRSVIRRARRSPLEHVRALATALRAARGHDVAVDLLARGLRRRLSQDGRATRESTTQWLEQLQSRVRTPRARAAVTRLVALTRPGRSALDVLAAANAVEEVWQELRP